jgi:hypothetical protein
MERERRFSYKGKDYRTDVEGNVHEDSVFGSKVGKIDKDGNFTIKTGIFSEERGRISWTGDVYETDTGIFGFGGDKDKVGKEKSGCFIATAVYGGENTPEVEALRRFRDDFLARTYAGRAFIAIYYSVSPPIARLIKTSELSKKLVKAILSKPVLWVIQQVCRKHY